MIIPSISRAVARSRSNDWWGDDIKEGLAPKMLYLLSTVKSMSTTQ